MYNSIYPTYVNSYLGVRNRQITRKQDDEKSSQSSKNAENTLEQKQERQNSQNQSQTNNNVFPNGERVAIDYTRRQINIAQVLSDFKNTANAIGAPDDVKAEVSSYLTLIESQSQKENPNAQIIQSNLKSASQILDEYITNTLKKPSKVVENWVDALFLQHIDYKSNVELQPQEVDVVAEEQPQEISEQPINDEFIEQSSFNQQLQYPQSDIYVPQDARLKSMFIQAKKYIAIDDKEKALDAFRNVLDYAEELGDTQACAMVHYEQGKLYDDFNLIEDALYNFDRAAKETQDNNIKARAHLSMGKIYDDFVKFEPALDHYCAAVSFAGESDNLKLQTKALSDITQMHTNRYDKESALMFMNMAEVISNETKNDKLKGITLAKNAKCCEKLNEKARALELYGKSAGVFSSAGEYESLAKDYKNAADLMLGYGNKAKAKKLLSKAYLALQKCDNPELKQEVVNQITSL